MIDLTKFCATGRYPSGLAAPWSRGEWSYASDGHIAVRVPRRDDVPENPQAPAAEVLFAAEAAAMRPLPSLDLSAQTEPCPACDGRGLEHDCPDCDCQCDHCGGSGRIVVRNSSIGLGGVLYALQYVALLAALPDIQIARDAPKDVPLRFRFAGGEVVLMPRNFPAACHIEEPAKARGAP